jgi:uncharacterized membrane protein
MISPPTNMTKMLVLFSRVADNVCIYIFVGVFHRDVELLSPLSTGSFFHELVSNRFPAYLSYLYSALLITAQFFSHARLFSRVSRVSRLEWGMNQAAVLLAGCIPWSRSLFKRGEDGDDLDKSQYNLCMAIFAGNVTLVGVMNLLLFLVMATNDVVEPRVRKIRLVGLIVKVIIPLVAFLSVLPPGASSSLSAALLGTMFLTRIVTAIVARRMGLRDVFKAESKKPWLPVPRFEQLADAVFSIAGTLPLLQIRVPEVWPSGGAAEVLKDQLPNLFAFFAAFYVVSVQLYSTCCEATMRVARGGAGEIRAAALLQRGSFAWCGAGLLIAVAFLPYTVSVAFKFPHQGFAQMFMGIAILICGALVLGLRYVVIVEPEAQAPGPRAAGTATELSAVTESSPSSAVAESSPSSAVAESSPSSAAAPAANITATNNVLAAPGRLAQTVVNVLWDKSWDMRRAFVLPAVALLIMIFAFIKPEACRWLLLIAPLAAGGMDFAEHLGIAAGGTRSDLVRQPLLAN